MIFSDLYKAPRTTFSKFRNSLPHHGVPPPVDIDADLVSRDKARNKEAVKKYLAAKVRNDWEFTWPPVVAPAPTTTEANVGEAEVNPQATEDKTQEPNKDETAAVDDDAPRDAGEEADDESDAESVYSTISEDPTLFRPRAEWISDLSDDDDFHAPVLPYRFDNPDAVGAAVSSTAELKRTNRRRAVRDETKWNPGLACFEARRDAWTGAKTVRMKPKPPSPASPTSTRRLFWRHHRMQSTASQSAVTTSGSPPAPTSPLQPTATRTSTTTTSDTDSGAIQRTSSQESNTPHVLYPVHTVVPVPPPLLPPQNPMRASIQPSMYISLYDKVVVQNLQPSCPVNLADMLRACVVGWKRDGEWPPRPTYIAPAAQTPSADAIAMRQRKAQQQRNKNAAAAANGGATSGRRLSIVGFFHGSGSSANKNAAAATHEGKDNNSNNNNKENKEGKENQSQSHSDEGGGSSGKALFRRSLQRVFSLGQHGQNHGTTSNASGPLSPTGATHNEVTAAR